MKVYIVKAYDAVETTVYTTKESAEKAAEVATWEAGMGGSHRTYRVIEAEVKTEYESPKGYIEWIEKYRNNK